MFLLINTILTIISLIILALLVYENKIFTKEKKFWVYLLVISLIISLVFDVSSHYMQYADIKYKMVHTILKAGDLIISPFIAYFYCKQLKTNPKIEIAIIVICSLNAILVFISIFVPFIFYIDENNVYQNGICFFIYLITISICMVYVFISLLMYGKAFKRRNFISLILTFSLYVCSAIIEYFVKEDLHVAKNILVLCTYLIFIHQNEYTFQEYDKEIADKEYMLQIDSLSNLYSRYAYNKMLASNLKINDNTIIFSMDLNGLKTTNDNLGHLAGDEIIIGASKCIKDVLSPYGACFRTGGDEFIAICEVPNEKIDELYFDLNNKCHKWRGKLCASLSLSIGYARHCDYLDKNLEELIQLADVEMYKKKNEYYSSIKN